MHRILEIETTKPSLPCHDCVVSVCILFNLCQCTKIFHTSFQFIFRFVSSSCKPHCQICLNMCRLRKWCRRLSHGIEPLTVSGVLVTNQAWCNNVVVNLLLNATSSLVLHATSARRKSPDQACRRLLSWNEDGRGPYKRWLLWLERMTRMVISQPALLSAPPANSAPPPPWTVDLVVLPSVYPVSLMRPCGTVSRCCLDAALFSVNGVRHLVTLNRDMIWTSDHQSSPDSIPCFCCCCVLSVRMISMRRFGNKTGKASTPLSWYMRYMCAGYAPDVCRHGLPSDC